MIVLFELSRRSKNEGRIFLPRVVEFRVCELEKSVLLTVSGFFAETVFDVMRALVVLPQKKVTSIELEKTAKLNVLTKLHYETHRYLVNVLNVKQEILEREFDIFLPKDGDPLPKLTKEIKAMQKKMDDVEDQIGKSLKNFFDVKDYRWEK